MNTSMGKRNFDLAVSLLTSVLWVPVLLGGTLAIAILEGRPVFYFSRRKVGAEIKSVPKFRTMIRDAEKICNREAVPVSNNIRFLNTPADSPLYTTTGQVIERFALTELPQLFLVLKNDMSLVGNRPLPENVIDSLKENYPNVNDRFDTPAGLTGPAQLVGRERITDKERLELEITYCQLASQNYSWRLDFMILLYTVLISLRVTPGKTVNEVKWFMRRYVDADEALSSNQ